MRIEQLSNADLRLAGKVPTNPEAGRMLLATTLLSVVLVVWALGLYAYGTTHMQGQIAFFIGITVIGCIFCLMHLPRASLLVSAVVNIPFVLFFAASGSWAFAAIAVNVSLVMMVILGINYTAFANLIRSRRSILTKQTEMEALAAATLWPPHLRLSFNLSMQDTCSSDNVLRQADAIERDHQLSRSGRCENAVRQARPRISPDDAVCDA